MEQVSAFRLIATLGIAGLISGLTLVGVYELTLPIIEQNQAEAIERAVFKVLPGTETFKPLKWEGNKLLEVEKGEIYAGYSGDSLIGYAIPAEGTGFQDVIKLIYGFNPETTQIVGLEILESKETPGLGDKIFKDADFVANFSELYVLPSIMPVSKGSKSNTNEVDCITGATISSKAVVKILNESNQVWLERLEGSK